MNAPPAFMVYAKDIISSPAVLLMSPEARGGFLLLMCWSWDPPANPDTNTPTPCGSVPDHADLLAQLSGLGAEGWSRCEKAVRRAFVCADGLLTYTPHVTYRASLEDRRTRQAEAGRKGNDAKWAELRAQKASQCDRDPIAVRSRPDRDPIATASSVAASTASTASSVASASALSEEAPSPSASGGEPKREKRAKSDRSPSKPLPFKPDEVQERLRQTTGGRYVPSPLLKGRAITLTKQIIGGLTLDEVALAGAWLGAGGDGYKGTLDGRALVANLAAWVAQAQAWDAAGRPSLRSGSAPTRMVTRREPSDFAEETEGVVDLGRYLDGRGR